jgi:phospholipid/cholesterol/gamma-HCH transport system ATP-binding protein
MNDDVLIVYRGVKKRFGNKVALDGVDLDIRRGETLAILGPSGGGKTLLLKMLVGLVRADEGVIRFADIDLAHADERVFRSIRPRIGFVFQASALFDSLTVGDNVGYALRVTPTIDRKQVAARVSECLGLVGLADTEPLMPSELSGGMRKRVAVARALATRPEVLLYDEPTAGLDPANIHRIGQLINDVRESQHTTGVVVTHDRDLAFAVANRVALLSGGRIAWAGSNEEAQHGPVPLTAFWSGLGVEERP